MKIKSSLFSTIFLGALLVVVEAQAGTLDDIGFTDLKLELGSALPDGSSITVTQVEAPNPLDSVTLTGPCIPNKASAEFSLITFNDYTQGTVSCTGAVSSHATAAAQKFYGSITSALTAIGSVDLFEANDWLGAGFLNTGGAGIGTSSTRIANHSWQGDAVINGVDWNPEILRRLDYLVEVDEFIQVVAMVSSPNTVHLLSTSFNAIVVSLSKGSSYGTGALDSTYVANRTRPDIVAPESTMSSATPRVASATALLADYGHSNTALSTDPQIVSTINTNGDTIYNAERSETIKAVLMAGADRNTVGNSISIDITDYRVDLANQTSNGLDRRFGAGQVNIYNSYHILAAGEQNSTEDGGTAIANTGFDYDPTFGGLNSSNATATYSFSTNAIGGQKIKASLVWNLDVLTESTDVFYDLDLELVDVATNLVVASSASAIDNTENIWFDLLSNHDYQLKVIRGTGQAVFNWDYALAWQIVVPGVTIVETASTTVTAEDGSTDTFTLVLDSPPAGDVVINLSSSNTSEATVSPASVTFTSSNWSTLQTVTVTGVNDAVDDGDINYNINFSVSSAADVNYNGMTLPSVSASNMDDDATFSFTDQTNVALNTLITSDTVVITGLLKPTAISITGGEYSINGGAYPSAATTINNGDSVTVRTISSVTGLTSVNTILTIGDVNDTFTVTTEVDTDGDGVVDSADNCPVNANADQLDTDSDGAGNTCDADDDNDGLSDIAEITSGTNPLLANTDADGVNDNADAFPNNAAETVDAHSDTVGDNADNCPAISNTSQTNTDADAEGDACDVDDDNDGLSDTAEVTLGTDPLLVDTDSDKVNDNTDNCPITANTNQLDTDSDGAGNVCDTDDDNDGLSDTAEAALGTDPLLADTDGDLVGDNADAFPTNIAASVDADADGLPDAWNASCDATCQNNSGLTLDVAIVPPVTSSGGGSLGLMSLFIPFLITVSRRRAL